MPVYINISKKKKNTNWLLKNNNNNNNLGTVATVPVE